MRKINIDRMGRYEDGGAFKGHPYAFDDAFSNDTSDMSKDSVISAPVKKEKPSLPLADKSNAPLGVAVSKDFKESLKEIANKDIVKDTLSTAKTNMNAVLIGGVIGIVFSYATKRSAIIGALMGGVLGGATAYGYKKIFKK